jgi:hypothetical protein
MSQPNGLAVWSVDRPVILSALPLRLLDRREQIRAGDGERGTGSAAARSAAAAGDQDLRHAGRLLLGLPANSIVATATDTRPT